MRLCPYCGGSDIDVADYTEVWGLEAPYRAECGKCGGCGPCSATREGAADLWNCRPIEDAAKGALESVRESLTVVAYCLPAGSVALGSVQGAFFGVPQQIEDALALMSGQE